MFTEISYLTKTGYVRVIHVSKFTINLNLSSCDIIHIDFRQFKKLRLLKHIDLSYNYIEEIDFTALECITRLKEISFKKNRITSLDLSVFTKAVHWKSLDISKNHVVVAVTPFESHLYIDLLDLSNNRLDQFDLIGFLPHIKKLRISGNKAKNVSYDRMPEEPTQNQKQKVESFIKKNTRDKPVKKLDAQISFLLTIIGALALMLVLYVRASQPGHLNSVYIYLGIINIIVSVCFPILFWWAIYRERSDWKIAIFKTIWMYIGSIVVVVIGTIVLSYSNVPFMYFQSNYDTTVVRMMRTLYGPIISFVIIYILRKGALSLCNLIDIYWAEKLFKSFFRNKAKLKTYIDVCVLNGSLDYIMWVFLILNYLALWPLISGIVITNLSRYIALPILSFVLILTMVYFIVETLQLKRNIIRKQIGALEIYSRIESVNVSKTDPFSHFPF